MFVLFSFLNYISYIHTSMLLWCHIYVSLWIQPCISLEKPNMGCRESEGEDSSSRWRNQREMGSEETSPLFDLLFVSSLKKPGGGDGLRWLRWGYCGKFYVNCNWLKMSA